jgi:hypothetical protein
MARMGVEQHPRVILDNERNAENGDIEQPMKRPKPVAYQRQ